MRAGMRPRCPGNGAGGLSRRGTQRFAAALALPARGGGFLLPSGPGEAPGRGGEAGTWRPARGDTAAAGLGDAQRKEGGPGAGTASLRSSVETSSMEMLQGNPARGKGEARPASSSSSFICSSSPPSAERGCRERGVGSARWGVLPRSPHNGVPAPPGRSGRNRAPSSAA